MYDGVPRIEEEDEGGLFQPVFIHPGAEPTAPRIDRRRIIRVRFKLAEKVQFFVRDNSQDRLLRNRTISLSNLIYDDAHDILVTAQHTGEAS
ncbi:hypothetical protein KQX54_019651 [Cotesia glomerata]|uniref:Uncharacterized protein n=1 Tax=Cotesia glomerata TaxID=32391 RepID=A0AAV7IDW0_COTGL|nr:hypothetical protein KQX54_019651 [Cotesia glomerata]